MAEATKKAMWTVVDTLATQGPREHDVGGGKRYMLEAEKPVEMPPEHAMVFLIDRAFEVRSSDGELIDPMPTINIVPGTGGIILEAGQCVALLSELTDGALRARCARRPGGQVYAAAGDRGEMIDFLRAQTVRTEGGDASLADGDVDAMPMAAVDRMLGNVSRQRAF